MAQVAGLWDIRIDGEGSGGHGGQRAAIVVPNLGVLQCQDGVGAIVEALREGTLSALPRRRERSPRRAALAVPVASVLGNTQIGHTSKILLSRVAKCMRI